jgi:hypothetical protein
MIAPCFSCPILSRELTSAQVGVGFKPRRRHAAYMKRHDLYFRAVIVYVLCKAIATVARLNSENYDEEADESGDVVHDDEGDNEWLNLQLCAASACAIGEVRVCRKVESRSSHGEGSVSRHQEVKWRPRQSWFLTTTLGGGVHVPSIRRSRSWPNATAPKSCSIFTCRSTAAAEQAIIS